jgi:hypothetical protein
MNNNLKKNLAQGEGNRIAEGASVLGTGNNPADHSHVSTATPISTKQKELDAAKAERLGTELGPDLDKVREKRTTQLRRDKDVKAI